MNENIEAVRNGLRQFNRKAGVLKSDPYGIGLSLSHCSALIDIDKNPGIKPSVLTSLLHLEKSTVSRLLENLEKKGFVHIKNDALDGRGKTLTITSKGRKMVEVINDASNKSVEDLFKKISSQERQIIVRAFELISKTSFE
jgi:DNA-binding MarR family transcriptional regulator